jgi:hypothetical protein
MSEALEKFTPKDIIRTETALSRFPIHRLSKKGDISIEIRVTKPNGELKTKWEVDYSRKHGQPSPLAYKIDTLIINRIIEEAGKPVSKLIRLGSLSEIAEELGLEKEREAGEPPRKALTRNTSQIKKALLQNASSFITAKFTYKTTSGEERFAEIADTRYGIIFTGEKLPGGGKADAVYIVLHDIYREILNNAQTRPLDYDYMRELTPTAQRFYELLSYQVYAALKNKTTAKMLYSEFCTYAPQTRYFDWEHIKKQMYKLHRPHLAGQYIEKIQFEKRIGEDGQPDWMMIYSPGERAKGQHTAFQRKPPMPRIRLRERNEQQLSFLPEERPEPIPEPVLTFTGDEEALVSNLKSYGITEKKARGLVKSRRQAVEEQLAAYPYRTLGEEKKNPAGWLIAAIEYGESGYPMPELYLDALAQREAKRKTAKRQQKEDTKRAKEVEEREAVKRAEEKFSNLPENERRRLLDEYKAKLLALPEWASQKPGIVQHLIGGAAKAAIIEDMMRRESNNE